MRASAAYSRQGHRPGWSDLDSCRVDCDIRIQLEAFHSDDVYSIRRG